MCITRVLQSLPRLQQLVCWRRACGTSDVSELQKQRYCMSSIINPNLNALRGTLPSWLRSHAAETRRSPTGRLPLARVGSRNACLNEQA